MLINLIKSLMFMAPLKTIYLFFYFFQAMIFWLLEKAGKSYRKKIFVVENFQVKCLLYMVKQNDKFCFICLMVYQLFQGYSMSDCLVGWLTVSSAEGQDLPKKRCPEYDTKLNLMLRLQFWRFEECRITLHCHYSQVHSDL